MVLNLNNRTFKLASQFSSQICGGKFGVKVTGYNFDHAVSQFREVLYRVFHEADGLQILHIPDMLGNERPIACQNAGCDVEFSANRQHAAIRKKLHPDWFWSVSS
jgi:hypothetical protein